MPNRIDYSKVVLTYRALKNLTPGYITSLMKPMSQVHFLNLRSSENGPLYVPESRTSLFSGSFSCSAPRLWNALPQCVREAGSLERKTQEQLSDFTYLNQHTMQCIYVFYMYA